MPVTTTARDLLLSAKAKVKGANYSLRIIWEAREAGIPISAGFSLVEKESDFSNVFGRDSTASIPASWKGTVVTKTKYLTYKARRPEHGMQGVGPTQLTWHEFQNAADRLGGCWVPKHNIRVGFGVFGGYYKANKAKGLSTREALRLAAQKYNGVGPDAVKYGYDFLVKYDRWHKILN